MHGGVEHQRSLSPPPHFQAKPNSPMTAQAEVGHGHLPPAKGQERFVQSQRAAGQNRRPGAEPQTIHKTTSFFQAVFAHEPAMHTS